MCLYFPPVQHKHPFCPLKLATFSLTYNRTYKHAFGFRGLSLVLSVYFCGFVQRCIYFHINSPDYGESSSSAFCSLTVLPKSKSKSKSKCECEYLNADHNSTMMFLFQNNLNRHYLCIQFLHSSQPLSGSTSTNPQIHNTYIFIYVCMYIASCI